MSKTRIRDPEIIDYRLDLTRPELRQVLDRYFPHVALVVTGRSGADRKLRAALAEDGWRVEVCSGPGRTNCPIMHGNGSCHLRREADVAVIYVDGRTTGSGSGLLPRLLCAADRSSPAVVALEGRADPISSTTGHAVVGALRDPVELVTEIRHLVSPDHAPSEAGPASP